MTEADRPATAGPRVVRIGILGLGSAAERMHLPACAALPGTEVVAACEPDAARRARLQQRFGIPAVYADAEALLRREKPDVVIVGTPPSSHRDLCLLALAHGAHVFCEKPFVRRLEEADEVIEAAERHRLSMAVNNQYRFMRIYRLSQARLARGDYGTPFLIQCWQQMFHPPSRERNWRAELVESTLYEFGTHPLDLVCFFFDAHPVAVTAHMPRPRRDIVADVVVQVTLRFPGERLATLAFNRLSHAVERYLEMRIDCEHASLRISFGGVARASLDWSRAARRPIARFSLSRGGEARVERGGRSAVVAREVRDALAPATALSLAEFLQGVRGGTPSTDRARHARDLLRIVFAGYESARTGETVWLGPTRG